MPEFKIQHLTRYTYESAVRDSANQIILFPIRDEYQEVIKHDLKISGDPEVDIHIDYYGNEVGSFTHTEAHTKLEICSKILVSTKHRMFPIDDMFPDQQWNDLLGLRYNVAYIDFLRQEYFAGLHEMQQIVETEKQPNETPYQTAIRYCKYVYENFEYIKGVTTVETTLDEIWKLKAGVCQDFAHILMEMLRVVNIPARYVSGYICTNMRGEGATHAWAEAYIPNYGWLGLDPTNNIIANENHVRLAVGRNFSDCSPVKGVYKGASAHSLEVIVTVGNENDVMADQYDKERDALSTKAPIVKPIKQATKNSYREYLDIIQQQQQQQQ